MYDGRGVGEWLPGFSKQSVRRASATAVACATTNSSAIAGAVYKYCHYRCRQLLYGGSSVQYESRVGRRVLGFSE